jgi:hypothetical protein
MSNEINWFASGTSVEPTNSRALRPDFLALRCYCHALSAPSSARNFASTAAIS